MLSPDGTATSTAKITLIDEGTLVARNTVSNDEGEYTFASGRLKRPSIVNGSHGFIALPFLINRRRMRA